VNFPPVEEQYRRLRLVDPIAPIAEFEGEHGLICLLLPDGRQVINVTGGYDLWENPATTGRMDMTLDQLHEEIS